MLFTLFLKPQCWIKLYSRIWKYILLSNYLCDVFVLKKCVKALKSLNVKEKYSSCSISYVMIHVTTLTRTDRCANPMPELPGIRLYLSKVQNFSLGRQNTTITRFHRTPSNKFSCCTLWPGPFHCFFPCLVYFWPRCHQGGK